MFPLRRGSRKRDARGEQTSSPVHHCSQRASSSYRGHSSCSKPNPVTCPSPPAPPTLDALRKSDCGQPQNRVPPQRREGHSTTREKSGGRQTTKWRQGNSPMPRGPPTCATNNCASAPSKPPPSRAFGPTAKADQTARVRPIRMAIQKRQRNGHDAQVNVVGAAFHRDG